MIELTKVQIEFLKILKSFMRNTAYELSENFEEMAELFQMAQVHQMTAAVYEQIRQDGFWQKEEYRNLFAVWKRGTIRDVLMQMQRAEGFLAVYEKLCEAGIRPLVVKGLICRNMYAKPAYRISGDEDMLIRKEDFADCDRILIQEGFQREELDVDNPESLPYEIPYWNKANGVYIELHFSLFPEESGAYGHLNEEFGQVYERSVCEEIQGKKVWTLCPTEHLFYLICHSFKHFLHSGFGLRQVCDMVLMAEEYGNRPAGINWSEIQERLNRLNMKIYWDALVKIGVEYFGFSYEAAAYPEKMQNEEIDCGAMLKDLLESGIYGDSTMERKHSSNMTLAAAAGGKASTTASLWASLFPEASYMKEKFPWSKKYPILLPATYVVRIVRYLKASSRKNKGEENSVQIGMERVELMKKYRIIE